FLIVELPASILELADGGLAQRSVVAVGVVQAPLPGLRIVETQGQNLEVTGRPIGLELDEIGAAVPDLPDHGRALVLEPRRGPGQGALEAAEARLPGADLEIEIVLPVPRRGGLMGFGGGRGGGERGRAGRGADGGCVPGRAW